MIEAYSNRGIEELFEETLTDVQHAFGVLLPSGVEHRFSRMFANNIRQPEIHPNQVIINLNMLVLELNNSQPDNPDEWLNRNIDHYNFVAEIADSFVHYMNIPNKRNVYPSKNIVKKVKEVYAFAAKVGEARKTREAVVLQDIANNLHRYEPVVGRTYTQILDMAVKRNN